MYHDQKHHLRSFAIQMSALGRVLLICGVLGLCGNAPAAAAASFASHLAVYDIKLKHAEQRSGISDVTGRLVVELNGSDCEGWSVGFRMVSRFLNSEGDEPRLIDLQSTSWESNDGREMRYSQREFLNNTLDSETKLTANHRSKGAPVELRLDAGQAKLPADVVFPMTHQRRIIEAALAGKKLDRSVVYDGSEGEKYYTAVTFIGPELKGVPASSKDAEALANLRSWKITIGYFDLKAQTDGEDVPAHQISMRMFENGVSSDLVMDYGDMQLEGRLSEFEMHKARACP